jgi:hypothetical protein
VVRLESAVSRRPDPSEVVPGVVTVRAKAPLAEARLMAPVVVEVSVVLAPEGDGVGIGLPAGGRDAAAVDRGGTGGVGVQGRRLATCRRRRRRTWVFPAVLTVSAEGPFSVALKRMFPPESDLRVAFPPTATGPP